MPGAVQKRHSKPMVPRTARPKAKDFLDTEEVEDEMEGGVEDDGEEPDLDDEDITGSDSEAEMGEDDSEGEIESDESEPDTTEQLKSVSFGALARAQDSLARKRKRDTEAGTTQDDKLGDVRARLQDLKRARLEASTSKAQDKKTKPSKHNSDSDDSSASSDSDSNDDAPRSRSSKHAPASQSSRYQVSRRREVVDVPKRHTRDPRFGPLPGSKLNTTHTSKAYDFLHDYADGEMRELRAAIKKSRSEDEKTVLRRKLMSMENQKRTRTDKELLAQVDREHRKKEQEAVAQGKRPHYLKKSERMRLAQVKRFEGLSEGQREKVIEKRRLKEAQKEKRNMPASRRIA